MRRIRKMSGVLAMAVTIAMTGMNGVTAFAAEDVEVSSDASSSDSTGSSSTSSDSDSTSTDSSSSDSSSDSDSTSDNTSTTRDDNAGDDNTAADDTASNGSDDVATDTVADSDDSASDVATDDATDNQGDDSSDDTIAAMYAASFYANGIADGSDTVANYDNMISLLADDGTDDTLPAASVYLTNNDHNYRDNDAEEITVNLVEGDELSKIIKLNLVGANFKGLEGSTYSIADGEDLTNWCTNLPQGISMLKYTNNNNANYGRVKFVGTTDSYGNFSISIKIPKERLDAISGYRISDDGATVSFILNVDGLHIPVSAPVEEVFSSRSKHSHSSTPQIEEGDYEKFCREVAEQITGAEANGSVFVETDKWVIFEIYKKVAKIQKKQQIIADILYNVK